MSTSPTARSAVEHVTVTMPRLAVAAVETKPYTAMRHAMPRSPGPPESRITVVIATDCSAVTEHTAMSTAVQVATDAVAERRRA